jgi:hypothetical protein
VRGEPTKNEFVRVTIRVCTGFDVQLVPNCTMSLSESLWLKWYVNMCPIAPDLSATTSTVMYVLYMAVTGSVCLSFCTERRKLRIRKD